MRLGNTNTRLQRMEINEKESDAGRENERRDGKNKNK